MVMSDIGHDGTRPNGRNQGWEGLMSRVMLYHCQPAEERALLDDDVSFVCCEESEDMMQEVALDPPDVVVYEIRPDSFADLAVLRLLRRVAPRIPVVVVAADTAAPWDIPTDQAPLLRSPLPVEEEGLREAVHNALGYAATAS